MKNLLLILLFFGVTCCIGYIPQTKRYKMPKKNRIEFAAIQEFDMTYDPSMMSIPKHRLIDAHKSIQSQQKLKSANQLIWAERGPNNVGGRVRTALFDLNDATGKTVFAAGISGGLWKTQNIESSDPNWQNIDDFFSSLSISALEQNPANPNEMYFGTGEGFFEVDASPGMGIWKSSNGGSSWTHLASSSNFKYVQKIKILHNGNILVSTKNGLYLSNNGGTSWLKVLGMSITASTNDANDIELGSDGAVYVSMGLFSTDGIYKSIDNGATWTKLSSGLPNSGYQRIEMATAPNNANVIYALFQSSEDKSCSGIFKSLDKGEHWMQVTNPGAIGMANFARTQAWYNLSISVDPLNHNSLYIGGIDLMKSTNGGTSWSQVTQWGGLMGKQYMHADQHLILFSPMNSNKLLIGNDGGIYFANNASSEMPTVYAKNKGLNITQFYACTALPSAGMDYFLAGAQDNGSQKFTGTGINTTQEVSGGDGAYCFIDKDNPNIQITSYVFNNYFVSTDGGASFTLKSLDNNGLFANPSYYDSDMNKLYSSSIMGSILRWENPTGMIPSKVNVAIAGMEGQRISYIKASPSITNRLYLGTTTGDVYVVDNIHVGNNKTATKLRDASVGFVSSIDVDSQDEAHIIFSYSNYGLTSIYETTNGGNSWDAIEGNLSDMPIRSVLFHPHNSDQVIIGTELGVFTTDNINGNSTQWLPSNNGLANVRIDMIHHRESDNLLAVATHGRGLYTSTSLGRAQGGFETDYWMTMEEDIYSNNGNCYEDYSILNIPVTLSSLPTGGTTVQVKVDQALTTCTVNRDYILMTNSLNFNSGSSLTKNIQVRIIDDAICESSEELHLTLSSNNVDLSGSDQITIEIQDNDIDPVSGLAYVSMGSSNISANNYPFGGYYEDMRVQMIFKASELRMMGLKAGPINALSFEIMSKVSGIPFNDFSIKIIPTQLTAASLVNTPFESNGQLVYSADFNTKIGWNQLIFNTPFNWNGVDNLILECCYNNNNWSDDDPVSASQTSFMSVQYRQADSNIGCTLPTVQKRSNIRPNIRFYQSNTMDICSNVASKSTYISAQQTAHFYHNGAIMASITNLSNTPLACVDLSIDRANVGNGLTNAAWLNNNSVSSKTFYVDSPANSLYEISLYYTAEELQSWSDPSTLSIIKTEVPIKYYSNQGYIVADQGQTEIIDVGNGDKLFKAQFTGFSGFGLINASINESNATLPIVLTHVEAFAKKHFNLVTWEVEEESDVAYYAVEKSFEARVFEEVSTIPTSNNKKYNWKDYELTFSQQQYYYRVKVVNQDGSFQYTDVVSAYVGDVADPILLAYPNPVSNRVIISKSGNIQIRKMVLTSVTGQVLRNIDQVFEDEIGVMEIEMNDLTSGVYILRYTSSNGVESHIKLIKE